MEKVGLLTRATLASTAHTRNMLLVASLAFAPVPLFAQSTGATVRKHRTEVAASSVAPAVLQAEVALQKGDYASAEPLLLKVVAQDQQDYRAWFDLGFVYRATKRSSDAIDSYRRSVALKPEVFESNLNLGQLFASSGDDVRAEQYLRAATHLKPESKAAAGLTGAWLSLAHLLEQRKERYADALDAYHHAATLSPKDEEPHIFAGALLEKQDRFSEAEAEYKTALVLEPKSKEALAGLVNAYTRENRLHLAENTLRDYLTLDPSNPAARLQMGRLLLKSGKTDEALSQFEEGLRNSPQDFDLQHEIASMYASARKYGEAATRYAPLVEARPNDPDLRLQYGIILMQLKSFRPAEEQLLAALKLNPRLTDAYGNLAVAAAENKDYPLAIKALDARAKLVPEAPSTYFLRATAYDNLKSFKEASNNYRQFLAVSNGKYPDQEWQARHRLIAIDKDNKQKK